MLEGHCFEQKGGEQVRRLQNQIFET